MNRPAPFHVSLWMLTLTRLSPSSSGTRDRGNNIFFPKQRSRPFGVEHTRSAEFLYPTHFRRPGGADKLSYVERFVESTGPGMNCLWEGKRMAGNAWMSSIMRWCPGRRWHRLYPTRSRHPFISQSSADCIPAGKCHHYRIRLLQPYRGCELGATVLEATIEDP